MAELRGAMHQGEQQMVAGTGRPRQEAETVLIVDDSPTVRRVVRTALSEKGHSVSSAADGIEALAQAFDIRPCLVLLDVSLPGLDGYQVCRIIKSNPTTTAIPIVMLSGKTSSTDIERGMEAGAADYVCKPFDKTALVRTAERWSSRGRRDAPSLDKKIIRTNLETNDAEDPGSGRQSD